MGQTKQDVELGRFLSLVLRHNPSAAFITLDKQGWAEVDQLLLGCQKAGKRIDMEILELIVRENEKQRYRFDKDHTKIRANQGHSISVDLGLKEVKPPLYLYHGTASRFVKQIFEEGIKKESRQYVHLSEDKKTARKVGSRHGAPAILSIYSERMYNDGYSFYLSENGVWLCDKVPQDYINKYEIEYPK